MADNVVNPQKLTRELLLAGLPVAGVASNGRVDYFRDLTASEKTIAANIIAKHDPSQSTYEARIEAYFDAGISIQDLVFALWFKIMQEDSSYADDIQEKIESINALIN